MADILIVDDQPYVRELLSEELILAGHRVHTVGDAESAREHLQFCRPDLVLLDLYLDGPDGWEVLRDIKRQYPNLPVIIFTAYDSFRDDPRLSQADGYIIKGIDFDPLKQAGATLLRRKQDPQGTSKAKSHAPEVDLTDGFWPDRRKEDEMKFGEIRSMAKGMDINTYRMSKTNIIQAIQREEHNFDCYGTDRADICEELSCLWRADCVNQNNHRKTN